MEEKRRFVRLEQELSLTFARQGPTGILRGDGLTKNISPTGLYFVTKTPLGVGEKIAILLVLPKSSKLIPLEGRVKWSHPSSTKSLSPCEVGVEVSKVSDVDYTHYLLFVCDLLCDQLAQQKLL